MQILVVYEKHYTRYFHPDVNGSFLSAYVQLLKERVEEENWYDGKNTFTAQSIIDDYETNLAANHAYGMKSAAINLSLLEKKAEQFLNKRRNFEYEDFDIIDTAN